MIDPQLVRCGWCGLRVGVVRDRQAGCNRHAEHRGQRTQRCPGSGRDVTASPASDAVDQALRAMGIDH